MIFPKDPSDGMIFEASPGEFFQFSKRSNCWIRLQGFDSLKPATPSKDGLMSKEDFKKLSGLIVPPPQTTLKNTQCNTTFTKGVVELLSSDDIVKIEQSLQVGDDKKPWLLHENTMGYNFTIDLKELVEELEKRGRIRKVQIQGDDGRRGERGDNGVDRLDTGPEGPQGPPGTNSPFTATVESDPVGFSVQRSSTNRAIVDLEVDGENLVATRANIGSPSACPSLVRPKPFNSPWLLVVDRQEKNIKRILTGTNDCGVPCSICSTSLFYLDINTILDSIFQRFKFLLVELKNAKELLANSWLRTIVALFNEQKATLCCALENCVSRKRNTSERRYIETQRIAAFPEGQLFIDGDRLIIDMDTGKTCATRTDTCFIKNVCEDGVLGLDPLDIDTDTFGTECTMHVSSLQDQCISLKKPIGDTTTHENAGPGPGMTLDNGLTFLFMTAYSFVDGIQFRPRLITSDNVTFIWPFVENTNLNVWEKFAFDPSDASAIRKDGGAAIGILSAGTVIQTLVLDIEGKAGDPILKFGAVSLLDRG